jgi:uncharacterized membrane protein YfcA
MTILFKLLIFFAAVFTQTLAGFGSGLLSMAFLPLVLPVITAAPVVALLTSTLEAILLVRFRSAFNFKAVLPLTIASLFGIPIGVWALRYVSEGILLRTLGAVMTGYALYALLNFRLPELKHPLWTVVAGFTAGILSGAYSVGGPPVIIFGNCRRWQPDEFKSNLQGFFLVNDVIVIVTHAFSGNLTPAVWQNYLLALPMIAVGMVAGGALDKRMDPATFRKIVLGLLIIMGVRLMISG